MSECLRCGCEGAASCPVSYFVTLEHGEWLHDEPLACASLLRARFAELDAEVKRLLAEKSTREAYFANQVGAHRDSVQYERDINAMLRKKLAEAKASVCAGCGGTWKLPKELTPTPSPAPAPCKECGGEGRYKRIPSSSLFEICPSCGGTGREGGGKC